MRRFIKEEGGQVLALVLVLFILGSLLIAPTLAFTSTSLIAGRMYNEKSFQLFAADAGNEDALHKLLFDYVNTSSQISANGGTWPYTISSLNNKALLVSIKPESMDNLTAYHITSTASGNGSSTTVESYITSILFQNAVIANTGTISMGGGNGDINGGVYASVDPGDGAYKGQFNGAYWPTATQLEGIYKPQAQLIPQQPTGAINSIIAPANIGPKYIEGDLTITGSGNLTFSGTVYVHGNLNLDNDPVNLKLQGNTLYVTGHWLQTKQKSSISGPGAIIVEGPIGIWPNGDIGAPGAGVLIMSVNDTIQLKSGTVLFGTVAAGVSIDTQNTTLTVVQPTTGLVSNFPTSIAYWKSRRP